VGLAESKLRPADQIEARGSAANPSRPPPDLVELGACDLQNSSLASVCDHDPCSLRFLGTSPLPLRDPHPFDDRSASVLTNIDAAIQRSNLTQIISETMDFIKGSDAEFFDAQNRCRAQLKR
jgi:hypothetical protein